MEVGENRVCVFYGTEKREKEKDSRYIQEASAPAAEPCIRPVTCLRHKYTCNTHCCINRSQLSYGLTELALIWLTEMALIRADGVQPSLHLDEYVHIRTVYIWPCGPLRKYN
jgi:hypothetical protein